MVAEDGSLGPHRLAPTGRRVRMFYVTGLWLRQAVELGKYVASGAAILGISRRLRWVTHDPRQPIDGRHVQTEQRQTRR